MAATDIVTIAEATQYLQAAGNANSPLLDEWITAASLAVDDLCGPVVRRTITAEEIRTYGEGRVKVAWSHIVSASSVVEYDSDGVAQTLTAETYSSKPADGYRFWPTTKAQWVERRESGGASTFPVDGTLLITYVAGRFASTSTVSQRFKKATLMLIAHLWAVEHGTANTFGDVQSFTPSGFAVPRRVTELLGEEIRSRVAVG
jgi:hypothetical protein